MTEWAYLFKIGIALFAIVNPIGSVPIFISATDGWSAQDRSRTAKTAAFTVFLVLMASAFFGDGLLAFFEMPKGKKQQGDRNALGAMQHVSFAVSPDSQKRICARLKAANVPFDGPLEILPGIFSIYVFDPNDIRLEFSCQPSNGEGEPAIVPQVTQTKDEALRELKTLTSDKAWLDKATADLRD